MRHFLSWIEPGSIMACLDKNGIAPSRKEGAKNELHKRVFVPSLLSSELHVWSSLSQSLAPIDIYSCHTLPCVRDSTFNRRAQYPFRLATIARESLTPANFSPYVKCLSMRFFPLAPST